MNDTEAPIRYNIGCKEASLLFFAFTSTFLYSGAYYGWGPMQLLLEESGFFHEKCGDVPAEEICEEQTAALLNVRFVSQLTILASPLIGKLSDSKGPQYVAYFLAAMVFAGLVLIIVASLLKAYWMTYLAFSCLALAAWSGGLLTVQTGLIFQGKLRSRVISGLNACYDAGAMTYLGVWGISEVSTTTTLAALMAGYLGVAALCLGGLVVSWSRVLPRENRNKSEVIEEPSDVTDDDGRVPDKPNIQSTETENTHVDLDETATRDIEAAACRKSNNKNGSDSCGAPGIHEVGKTVEKQTVDDEPCTEGEEASTSHEPQENTMIVDRSKDGHLLSESVVLLCLFFSFHLSSNVWTLVTARDFLGYLGDDEYNNNYLSIFTLLMPVSLLALPFEDVAIHKFGFNAALQTVNVLSLAHGIIKTTTTNLNIQVLGFVIFSFFRCFLFAVTFSYLPSIVRFDLIGRAVGFFYLCGGMVSFINIPLSNAAINQLEGNFFIPNMVYLFLNLPFFYVIWRLGKRTK